MSSCHYLIMSLSHHVIICDKCSLCTRAVDRFTMMITLPRSVILLVRANTLQTMKLSHFNLLRYDRRNCRKKKPTKNRSKVFQRVAQTSASLCTPLEPLGYISFVGIKIIEISNFCKQSLDLVFNLPGLRNIEVVCCCYLWWVTGLVDG